MHIIEDSRKTRSTNRQADAPLRAEMQRSALNLSYDEQPMPDINPDKLDIRVASGLFAGLREWNENSAENLNLLTRHQGRVVPTIGGVLLFGTVRERYFSDAWIQCGRFRGTNKVAILDQQDVRDHLPLALERAFDFVKKHAMRSAEFGDLRRKDVWNVPEEVAFHFRVTFPLLRQNEAVENPIDLQILDCLARYEEGGGASMKQLVEWTGLVDRSVRRHLTRLIKAGQIVMIGKSTYDPNKRYLPAKRESE